MFVVIAFILLTVSIFFISGVYFFRSGYTLSVIYNYVSILDRGAPVRMAGVRIGEVSGVELYFDPKQGETRVRVKLFIEKGVEIRENYEFHIRGTHILSEPHIEVSPRPGSAPVIGNGFVAVGAEPVPIEDLVKQGHSIAHNLDEVVSSLRKALQDEESQKALREILVNMSKLTKSLEAILSGSEADMKKAVLNVEAAAGALHNVLNKMEKGEGTMGKLFSDDKLYEEMREFVAELKSRPWRLLKKDETDNKKK